MSGFNLCGMGFFSTTGGGGGGGGTVTSVGLSMPAAFNVANSPIISAGSINVTGAGTVSQYIRGDGSLANFPSVGGGGGGTVYYLNGNTNQGTFGGITMYQLSRAAGTGAAANFTKSTTGAIANFITDAGDPNQTSIPAGIWIVQAYLSETGGGSNSAQIQAIVQKWDGSTITTIATGQLEQITNGSTKDFYQFAVTIPNGTSLSVTDRVIVQISIANTNGKTVTLYTEDSDVASVNTTFANGIATLNGLTASTQFFATGTTGTDFGISSSVATHTFNLPTASAVNRGALSSADWTTFNSKVGGSGTSTRVAFWNASNTISSDADLYWDNTNKRLGIGTIAPAYRLDINGNQSIQGYLNFKPSVAPSSIRISSNDILNGGTSSNDVDRLVLIGNSVATNLSLKASNQGDSLIGIGFRAADSITTGGIFSIHIGRNSGIGINTGAYNTHIGSGDANNIPSSTRSTIHIIAAGGYSGNDAATSLTGLTSRYAFIGGGFSSAEYINNFYLGAAPFVPDSNLANLAIFAPSGVGTDLQGANFTLNAGRGTGSGTPGDLIFQTSTAGASGTTLQTLSQRFKIAGGTGEVTINNLSGSGTRNVAVSATGVLSAVSTITSNSFTAAGTGGAGFFEVVSQSATPTTPASGVRIFSNASNALAWVNTSGFVRNIDGSSITADRTYALPNKNITFAGIADETFTGLTTFNGTTQTGAGTTGILSLNQTWNTTGIVNALTINITNTASSTSSTGLLIQEGSANRFRFLISSTILFGSGSNNVGIGSAASTTGSGAATGTALRFIEQVGNSQGFGFWFVGGLGNRGYTSGTGGQVTFAQTFNPTSGTGVYNFMRLNPEINQTGGANGITRGVFVDPTLTAAADFRAIDVTNGSIVLPYTGQTTTYAIKTTDYLINCTSGTFTATLPTAVGVTGKIYKIVNSGSGTITIATTSSQTFVNINATPTTLTLGAVGAAAIVMYEVTSNGANWIVTGKVKNE